MESGLEMENQPGLFFITIIAIIEPYMGTHNSKFCGAKDIRDLHHHTAFTKKELKAWYDCFTKDFPSGSITRDEFKLLYASFFPHGDAGTMCEEQCHFVPKINQFDVDHRSRGGHLGDIYLDNLPNGRWEKGNHFS